MEESRVRAQVAEGSAFGPDRTRRLPRRAPGPAAPGRARGGTAAGGGSRSPHSCGCGSSPLSRPSLLGGGKWRVGVTECDCPRPLLPERERAIKAPLRPALHTPSASSQRSQPSGRHAGQLSPRRPPPARRGECRQPELARGAVPPPWSSGALGGSRPCPFWSPLSLRPRCFRGTLPAGQSSGLPFGERDPSFLRGPRSLGGFPGGPSVTGPGSLALPPFPGSRGSEPRRTDPGCVSPLRSVSALAGGAPADPHPESVREETFLL